jgi:glycosyltransferase involved in cell wall biosynthesis
MGYECAVAFGRRGNDLWKSARPVEIHFAENPNNPFARGRYEYITSQLKRLRFVPDVIIVRDIFLSITAQGFSQRYGVPLIVDIADNYPEVARQRFALLQGLVTERLLNGLEQKACRRADAITFVSQDSMDYVSKKHRLDLSEKGWCLPNFPMREDMDEAMAEGTLSENVNDRVTRGIYIGDFNPKIRDFATVLKGLRHYNREMSGARVGLVILPAQMERMKRYFHKFDPNYEDLITIKPVMPRQLLQNELRQYDFGLVPHVRSGATDYTVPNKLFDYLLAGLPFLVSNNPAIVNMVTKCRFGEFYDPGVSNSFEEALYRVASRTKDYKKDLHSKMSELRQLFCWDSTFEQCWTGITNRLPRIFLTKSRGSD